MKVNLLTIHYSLSCGAVLQTFATCKILESLGCEVTIINFKNPVELKRRKSVKFWLMNGITKMKFDAFRRNYFPKSTVEMFHIDYASLPGADCYVTGSDQIWNPKIVKENLYTYMLEFLPEQVKRISYASSFGLNEWNMPAEATEKVASLLGRFHSLSIREGSGVEICRNVFKLRAMQVLDPTLLLSNYADLIGHVIDTDEIVYFKLVYDKNITNIAAFLKRKLGMKNTLLYASYPRKGFDRNIMFCSPCTWLKKIASAKFVVTDSFHGLAFAILFQKQFIVYGGMKDRNTRLLSLLKMVGLEERYIQDYKELIRTDLFDKPINYEVVNKILEEERAKSLFYLKEALFGQ